MAYNSNKYTVKANFKIGAGQSWATTACDILNDIVTLPAHGYKTGDNIGLATTGAVPTGLVVTTAYYVIPVDANTIAFASNLANAQAGTKINLTAVGSGVNTAYLHGNGDYHTGIILPKGTVVVNTSYKVVTTATATASTATLAITTEGAGDIVGAAAQSTTVWDSTGAVVLGIPDVATVSDYKTMTVDRELIFTTAVSPWTAGELNLELDCIVLP